jgi:hypothetical protein
LPGECGQQVDNLRAMNFLWLPAQLFRRPSTVWGRVDSGQPGDGGGYEGLLAAMLILVTAALLVCLWICFQKLRLAATAEVPEGYEEYEELEHATEKGVKLLFVFSQVAAPLGALGAFVLGDGYELMGFGLPAVVLAASLPTFLLAMFAWLKVGQMRERLLSWREGLRLSGGDTAW